MTSYANDDGTLGFRLGLEIIEQTEDSVVVRVPVEGNRQPQGRLHGGMNAILIEEAGSRLAFVRAPQGRVPVGTELNCSNLEGVQTGFVTARAAVISQGRSSIVTRVDIQDDSGVLTASGRLTCVFIPDPRHRKD